MVPKYQESDQYQTSQNNSMFWKLGNTTSKVAMCIWLNWHLSIGRTKSFWNMQNPPNLKISGVGWHSKWKDKQAERHGIKPTRNSRTEATPRIVGTEKAIHIGSLFRLEREIQNHVHQEKKY